MSVYCMSLGMLTAQFVADSYGITLTAPDGTPIKSAIIDYVKVANLNSLASKVNTTAGSNNSTILDAIGFASYTALQLGWDLFLVMTGFYIFNVLVLFGIPSLLIVPITLVYLFYLVRTVIALIRGF